MKKRPRHNPVTMGDLRRYFAPGNIVASYAGRDRVLEFHEDASLAAGWYVKVQAILDDGSIDPDYPRPRVHATVPGPGAQPLFVAV